MKATALSPEIWNGISKLLEGAQSPREIHFVLCTKVDKVLNLVWAAEEFGDVSIPCVAFNAEVTYFDSDTNIVTRKTADIKIKPPKVGELIVVLDPLGAKRFPICLGILQSKSGYWEGE